MKILIVDDHSIFRDALTHLLVAKDPSLVIVGGAPTMDEAAKTAVETLPDLVVMDIMLSGASGIAAIRAMRQLDVPCRILVLTAVVEPGFVVDALAAGAYGYALKEQSIDDIIAAIHRVASGQAYVAPRLEWAVDRSLDPGTRLKGTVASLSTREGEVFRLVVAGYTNQRISAELTISVKTVETHRTRINKKLRVHSTSELLRAAALQGLVLEDPQAQTTLAAAPLVVAKR